MTPRGRAAVAKMLGSAVLSQALLSAASFIVGLVLIRRTSDLQYGYYVLASTAVLLMFSLHGAFVNPALVRRLTPLDRAGRADLIGGLHREQTMMLTGIALLGLAVCGILWFVGFFDRQTGPLVIATLAAAIAVVQRNFFRMVLIAQRRPHDVLRTDIYYAILLLGGTGFAIRSEWPAAATLTAMATAAAIAGALTARALWRDLPWNPRGAHGILRAIAPLAALSTAGAAIHWGFSQGFMYLAAGVLDVTAVAALAGTRLLMMPLNLLSTGIGTLMLPLTAEWLERAGPGFAWRRLTRFAAGMAALALCYFCVLWFTRDFIFGAVLKKEFLHQDLLLLLWCFAFLVMVVRDQLLYLLVARERFTQLTPLALASAACSLLAGYVGMTHWGVVGAPVGVLLGELVSVTGIVTLSLRDIAPPRAAVAVESA